jgi:alkylated DNA repair dioxygenase AlkB|eukprot:g857.t1
MSSLGKTASTPTGGKGAPVFVAVGKNVATSHLYIVPFGLRFYEDPRGLLERLLASFKLCGVYVRDTHSYVSFLNFTEARRCQTFLISLTLETFNEFSGRTGGWRSKLKVRFSRLVKGGGGTVERPAKSLHFNDFDVEGLTLIPDVISELEEAALLRQIDAQPWNDRLKRRVQHYGYEFDYVTRKCDTIETPPIPGFIVSLMTDKLALDPVPNQCTVNEYFPGQGISSHVDTHSAFGEYIISLSLHGNTVMCFSDADHLDEGKKHMFLPRRSLLIMKGEARYKWQHGISPRKTDVLPNGDISERVRRVSLTFRVACLDGSRCNCNFPNQCDSRGVPTSHTTIRLKKRKLEKS